MYISLGREIGKGGEGSVYLINENSKQVAKIYAQPPDRMKSAKLKAMAHEGRLLILCLLAGGEKPVTELEQALALRQPAVSQQLARLRADNLVTTRREGKTIYYSIASEEALKVVQLLYSMYCGPDAAKQLA